MNTVTHFGAGLQSGAQALGGLLQSLASGRVEVVDLGAILNEKTDRKSVV